MAEQQQQHQQQQQQVNIAEVSALPACLAPTDIILGSRGGERRGIEGRGIVHQIPGTESYIRLMEYVHQINSGHFYKGYLDTSNVPTLAVKCIYLFQYFQQAQIVGGGNDVDNEIVIRNYFERTSSVEDAYENHVILPQHVLTNRFQDTLIDQFERYFFIISPLASIGDIFDLLEAKGEEGLEEDDVKQLFRQMVNVIRYLHNNNIFHRDLKPDNFAVHQFTDVYVIDFGKASIETESTPHYNHERYRYGTAIYSPPELNSLFFDGNPQIDWKKADVWALGVSLFSIIMGDSPPWVVQGEIANPFDPIFQCICRERRLRDFLAYNEEDFPEISTSAIDLLQMMLIENPNERITIDEILNHPWIA